MDSEKPSGVMGEASVGSMKPHVLACRMLSTMAPSALAERTMPRTSSLGLAPSRTASTMYRERARMVSTRTTSPAKTTRQLSSVVAQPPTMGPTAMPAPATPPMMA